MRDLATVVWLGITLLISSRDVSFLEARGPATRSRPNCQATTTTTSGDETKSYFFSHFFTNGSSTTSHVDSHDGFFDTVFAELEAIDAETVEVKRLVFVPKLSSDDLEEGKNSTSTEDSLVRQPWLIVHYDHNENSVPGAISLPEIRTSPKRLSLARLELLSTTQQPNSPLCQDVEWIRFKMMEPLYLDKPWPLMRQRINAKDETKERRKGIDFLFQSDKLYFEISCYTIELQKLCVTWEPHPAVETWELRKSNSWTGQHHQTPSSQCKQVAVQNTGDNSKYDVDLFDLNCNNLKQGEQMHHSWVRFRYYDDPELLVIPQMAPIFVRGNVAGWLEVATYFQKENDNIDQIVGDETRFRVQLPKGRWLKPGLSFAWNNSDESDCRQILFEIINAPMTNRSTKNDMIFDHWSSSQQQRDNSFGDIHIVDVTFGSFSGEIETLHFNFTIQFPSVAITETPIQNSISMNVVTGEVGFRTSGKYNARSSQVVTSLKAIVQPGTRYYGSSANGWGSSLSSNSGHGDDHATNSGSEVHSALVVVLSSESLFTINQGIHASSTLRGTRLVITAEPNFHLNIDAMATLSQGVLLISSNETYDEDWSRMVEIQQLSLNRVNMTPPSNKAMKKNPLVSSFYVDVRQIQTSTDSGGATTITNLALDFHWRTSEDEYYGWVRVNSYLPLSIIPAGGAVPPSKLNVDEEHDHQCSLSDVFRYRHDYNPIWTDLDEWNLCRFYNHLVDYNPGSMDMVGRECPPLDGYDGAIFLEVSDGKEWQRDESMDEREPWSNLLAWIASAFLTASVGSVLYCSQPRRTSSRSRAPGRPRRRTRSRRRARIYDLQHQEMEMTTLS